MKAEVCEHGVSNGRCQLEVAVGRFDKNATLGHVLPMRDDLDTGERRVIITTPSISVKMERSHSASRTLQKRLKPVFHRSGSFPKRRSVE